MTRMNVETRRRWFDGTKREITQVVAQVAAGAVQCDTCAAPAVALGHQGTVETVGIRCADCFRSHMVQLRATRPTREQLVARVNAAIAQA